MRAYVISARKAKHLDVTTMFTYSHANTPLGQSERAYYLSYFIKTDRVAQCANNLRAAVPVFLQRPSIYNKKYPRSDTRAFRRVYDTTKNQVTSGIFTVYHEKASHD